MIFVGVSSLDADTITTNTLTTTDTSTTFISHTWRFSDTYTESKILNRVDEEYLYYIKKVYELCRLIPKSQVSQFPHFNDTAYWKEFGIPNCGQFAASTSDGDTTTTTVDSIVTSGVSGDDSTASIDTSITPEDNTPPTITILGNNPIRIQKGATYVDPGVSATDDQSSVVLYARVNTKDIIRVANISIDTSVVGENKIEYYASDNSGNKATATRIVYVYEPTTTSQISSSGSGSTSSVTTATESSEPLFDSLSTLVEPFIDVLNIGTTSTLTTASSIMEEEKINIIKPTQDSGVGGVIGIKAQSIMPITNMVFKVISFDRVVHELSARALEANYWTSEFDTKKLSNGQYFIVAEAKSSSAELIKSKKINIYIRNSTITTTTKTPTVNNLSTVKATTTTTAVATLSPDMYTSTIRSTVTWECREANITDVISCEEFMFRKNMPQECKERLVLTQAECDKIISEIKLPTECVEKGITTEARCVEYKNTIINISRECIDAGIKTESLCREFVFKKTAPKECIEAGIYTKADCEKHIFLINLPSECRNANILNVEACKKYMFEKITTSSIESSSVISPDLSAQIQGECREAGLKTIKECNTFLSKKYLPNECKEKGIENESDCNIYLTQKRIPKECRDSGIIGIQECDRFLFQKNLPKQCVGTDVVDQNTCRDFSFENNQTKIKCGDSNSCAEVIKERHMGSITSTQQKFEKIAEVVKNLENKPINIGNLMEELGEDNDIVPIVGTTTVITLIKTDETISLNQDEDLVQTSPIAIMFDTDNDGLSDDFERRIGTNPNNSDTDGDGVDDADEIKSNENPSGEGVLTIDLAPVEVALVSGATLEHPKTSGVVSEEMIIDSISNIEKTDSLGNVSDKNGYVFKGIGVPYSVVTLYIYSELPIVVTMQTDKYGNWQYELDRPLSDGEHEVYVAINDNTGKVVEKSGLLSFFVKEAQAFSVDEYLASANTTTSDGGAGSMLTFYIIITIISITLAVFLFGLFLKEKNKKEPIINEN